MKSNNLNSSTEYIVKLIEQNYSDFYIEMAKLKGCEYKKGNSYNWVRGNEGSWPTGIFDIRLQIDSINNTINDMVTRMKAGLLPNTIMTGPSSIPDNYDRYFNEFGLIRKYEAAGMAMNIPNTKLEYLNDDNDLEICILEDEELLFNWCKIVGIELFSKPDKKSIEDFCDLIRLTFSIDKFRCFVAKYKGRIIATSFLYLNKGIAGIYFVATDKAYRNKGVGKLITLAPLIFAQERGYRIVILQASPLGEVIYKKIGFKEYCRLGRYQLD
ncbi:MAG: hypothetical protein CVU84_02050 [Firmicutes bacterium HGW-Firmicutes-1]|jgi:GNAT superfamily N-acetyltransferase|nr:MAG: hypothetical protein CVU84_02050 [Firmicutes bacterium HGW-Firmicutes-1]